jgi:hypothetical protein
VSVIVAVRWWEGQSPLGELMLGVLLAMPFILVGLWALRLHERAGWRGQASESTIAGALAVLVGVVVLATMVQSPASAFHVPRWAAYLAATIFPVAGVIIIVSALGGADHPVVRLLAAVLVTCLASVAWVVAFHASDATMSIAGFSGPAGWLGNAVFGVGALITSAVAVSLWVWTFKRMRGPGGAST